MIKTDKTFSLADLATYLDAKLIGDAQVTVSGLADLASAGPEHVSFLSSPKYLDALAESRASAVVLREAESEGFSGNALIVSDPYLSYAKLSKLFETRDRCAPGIHPSAVVDKSASIGDGASIGPNCFVGANAVVGAGCELYAGVFVGERARIGINCVLFANVVLYHDVVVGDDGIIHANTTIGSDGFGFAPSHEGWKKIHQIGSVVIGNRVEIGANTAIDRGALGNTEIADGVIIDNQVHIAHNVKIGEGSAVAGCVGIAGSTTIGKNCQIAGAVSINGHIDIADNTIFHGGSVVTRGNREPGVFASATPMQDVGQWRKNSVRYRQLDDMFSRVKTLEKQLKKISQE